MLRVHSPEDETQDNRVFGRLGTYAFTPFENASIPAFVRGEFFCTLSHVRFAPTSFLSGAKLVSLYAVALKISDKTP